MWHSSHVACDRRLLMTALFEIISRFKTQSSLNSAAIFYVDRRLKQPARRYAMALCHCREMRCQWRLFWRHFTWNVARVVFLLVAGRANLHYSRYLPSLCLRCNFENSPMSAPI